MPVKYIFYKKHCQDFTRQVFCAYNSREQPEGFMNKMQLTFFCEESGKSFSDVARLMGCSRQKVWYWANCRETWVHCSDDFEIDRIESVNTKTIWER